MEYFAEHKFAKPKHVTRWYWRAFAKFMHWTSGLNPPWTAPRKPEEAVAQYWFNRYEPADALAGVYGSRYRSGYVWVFLLGTSALIFGAMALVFGVLGPDVEWLAAIFALAELNALRFIVVLVLFGIRQGWHEHAIEFRLLAELYRIQQVLAPLGWTLRLPASDSAVTGRAAWVAWLFAADLRAAPLPKGKLSHAVQGKPRNALLDGLIAEQLSYHTLRWKMNAAADHTLARCGEVLFTAMLVCVELKLLLPEMIHLPGWAVSFFGLSATVLPAVSAASVGISTYAELQLLAERSYYMVAELKRARHRIERVDTRRHLASQDLGNEAGAVATLMLRDLEGWAQLFRVKGIEPS
jgi:hypothetical protein